VDLLGASENGRRCCGEGMGENYAVSMRGPFKWIFRLVFGRNGVGLCLVLESRGSERLERRMVVCGDRGVTKTQKSAVFLRRARVQ